MDAQFDPRKVSRHWYRSWEDKGCFKPQDSADGRPAFCIVLPPPNVTGTLHMGHGFQVTLMDALIRYHRMLGEDVLWQGGTDHAGIATQMVVERQLEADGQSRAQLGREEFVRRVWRWKEQSGDVIARQLRQLGASIDWSRDRFTMDDGYSKAVLDVFVRLYEQGLIYRARRMVNWDPVLQTALSDLEVEPREINGNLWHIRYRMADDSDKFITVATTRPETMLGDQAVAVHPDDERYRHLVGKEVLLPLTGRKVPLIADDYVAGDFGSGCVKITPAHDFNDFEIGRRHGLQPLTVLDLQGAVVSGKAAEAASIPQQLQGLDRFAARRQVLRLLKEADLLAGTEPHRHQVPHGDRSEAVLEPMLTEQWFMSMRNMADRALQVVAGGEVRFVPDQWRNTYKAWLDDIRDWCLSRQLWWGHRIPAWYDAEGKLYVARSAEEAAAQAGCEVSRLRRDESVLDTWFSSALWTLAPLGWPDDPRQTDRWNPTSVLVTGFDIIFFWVARMVMMSLQLTDRIPFKDVFVHGLIRDARGKKMSKSRGNTLDPLDLIDGIGLEELVAKRTGGLMQPKMRQRIEQQTRREFPDGIPAYGTDALRFTFCALASHGRDIHFDSGQLEGYRNFCNKLWNAARFVLRRLDEGADYSLPEMMAPETMAPDADSLPERWILHRLQRTVHTVRRGMESYRLDTAAQAIYDFIWHQYCDWYLETAKARLDSADTPGRQRRAIVSVLLNTLEQALRLAHPLMPFITEELWQQVAPKCGIAGETLMLSRFPQADPQLLDEAAERDFGWVSGAVSGLRSIRSETQIHPAMRIPLSVLGGSAEEKRLAGDFAPLICRLAGAGPFELLPEGSPEPVAALHIQGSMRLLVPLEGLVDDLGKERSRLGNQLQQLEKRIEGYRAKLNNADYVAKAPARLVAETKAKRTEAEAAAAMLQQRLQALQAQ